eukprot:COSAG01_NODE_5583_length_4164_cov_29.982042_3_plen_67_part_00
MVFLLDGWLLIPEIIFHQNLYVLIQANAPAESKPKTAYQRFVSQYLPLCDTSGQRCHKAVPATGSG